MAGESTLERQVGIMFTVILLMMSLGLARNVEYADRPEPLAGANDVPTA
ncbi:MAG: hypothetical protein AAF570_16115 [Bacteroidota bacterium]